MVPTNQEHRSNEGMKAMTPEKREWFHAVSDELDAQEYRELVRHELEVYKMSVHRFLIEAWAENDQTALETPLDVFEKSTGKTAMPGTIEAYHKLVSQPRQLSEALKR
jgi:hypothetical protein